MPKNIHRKFAFVIYFFLSVSDCLGQNLFLEECFVGGVTAAGRSSLSVNDGYFKIKWSEEYNLKHAYILTYRFRSPNPVEITIGQTDYSLDYSSQFGNDLNNFQFSEYIIAINIIDVTSSINIISDSIYVFLDGIDYSEGIEQAWYSTEAVLLYDSNSIQDTTCLRIYTASQSQDQPQDYSFSRPDYKTGTDVGFAIYSDRINNYYEDRTCISINNTNLGCVWGWDQTNPVASGVRGHFYYENGSLEPLDDDTANTRVYKSDGIAIINDFLTADQNQSAYFDPVNHDNPLWGFNIHPAFFIAYTPNCTVSTAEMPRDYSFCKLQSTPRVEPDVSDTIQLNAIPGYDNYEWTPASGLSNSNIANPLCFADSSGWYRVRMWNDDEGGACSQTIPVFITVGKVPRPGNLQVRASFCPQNTGRIVFAEMAGKAPFQYSVNGNTKTNGTFENLPPGTYDVSVTDALGCTWDSTAVVVLDPIQTAAFTANPDSGYSPLRVVLTNQSTEATGYIWLINGTPFSNSTNTSYTFADTGTYVIALIAIRNETSCADTAYATIRVEQGLKIVVPNIITPNGDGRNDALVAQTAGVAFMRWEIRNRWGNLLHTGEATSPPPALTLWNPGDGDYPDGVYTIMITVKGESGELREFAAQVTVISG